MNYASNFVKNGAALSNEHYFVIGTAGVLNSREEEINVCIFNSDLAFARVLFFNGIGQAYHQELGPNFAISEIMLPYQICKGCPT